MKNLSLETRVSINASVPKKCAFRLHDGHLFWHGSPAKYSQAEHNGFIWPTNADLGPCDELSIANATEMTKSYLTTFGVDANYVTFMQFDEPYMATERERKDNKSEAVKVETKTKAKDETKQRKTRTPRKSAPAPKDSKPTTTPTPEAPKVADATPTTPQAVAPSTKDATDALTTLFAGVQANVVAQVMAQIQPLIEQAAQGAGTTTTIKVAHPNGETHEVKGKTCSDFAAMVQTLMEGEYLYLHGPAGCGKSYTAEQLAEACGLKFYAMQSVLYEHQVTGFVDANGKHHETPFSEAYTKGGLVLLDEIDGSSSEALLTINNALANGVMNVQGLGNVTMHPDFKVVAAGNTKMSGADPMYVARQVLDASTIDRFMFKGMTYDEDIERAIARGDDSIVEFAHDVRNAIAQAGLFALCSYRTIKRLANTNLQKAYGDTELLRAAFVKNLGQDEVRLIYSRLSNNKNRWAKALKTLL